MKQMIIIDDNGLSYATYKDLEDDMRSSKKFDITLLNHDKKKLKRKDVQQYWIKDYSTGEIISTDDNGYFEKYEPYEQDARHLFRRLFQHCKGRIEPHVYK